MADTETLITLTADIVASFVSNNTVSVGDTPDLIRNVHDALAKLGEAPAPVEPEKPKGAVSARASIKPDGLISMIDGRKYQTLRRHISGHGYTPESYRETFGLPRDYPMVSANYSETRRAMAKKIGLGRKRGGDAQDGAETQAPQAEADTPKPAARRGRPPKAQNEGGDAPAPAKRGRRKAETAEA